MKNLITLFAVFSLIAIYSCQPKGEPCPEVPAKHPHGVFELTPNTSISKDTFDVWVNRWNDNYRSYMATDSLHYFNTPLVDLTTIVNNTNVDGARMYMGMSIKNNGNLRPHILIVGTIAGQPDFSAIMDYTTACPKNCPK